MSRPTWSRGTGRRSAVIPPPRLRRSTPSTSWPTSGVCCSALRSAASPIPRTHFVDGRAGLKPLISQIEYPAVVKPVRSRIRTDAGWLPATVQYAHSESELLRLYQDTRIPGRLSVADPGAHRRAGHRRLRVVRSRPAARGVRASPRPREATLRRGQRPLRKHRARPGAARPGDAPARTARLARRGDDGVQAGPANRTIVPHGSERPLLGIAGSGGASRRRLSVSELSTGTEASRSRPRRHTRSASEAAGCSAIWITCCCVCSTATTTSTFLTACRHALARCSISCSCPAPACITT